MNRMIGFITSYAAAPPARVFERLRDGFMPARPCHRGKFPIVAVPIRIPSSVEKQPHRLEVPATRGIVECVWYQYSARLRLGSSSG
jgi:hypothetical protein